MDGKVAARADKWLIKQYEEETNVRATVVVDVSKSMDWKSRPTLLTKLAYAERLAAALSLLLIRQRDSVGLIRFDDQLRSVVPSRSRSAQFKRILTALADPGSGMGSDAAGALAQAGKLIRRRGIVILISDLLLDAKEIEDTVHALRAQGHDVTVLHLLDPAERQLDLSAGESLFVDPERGDSLAVTPAVQEQLADERLVTRADRHPAAPVRAAGDRLHPTHAAARRCQVNPGVVIAFPAPGAAGPDGGGDRFAEHLGQGAASRIG